jgi:hypothetical protein
LGELLLPPVNHPTLLLAIREPMRARGGALVHSGACGVPPATCDCRKPLGR